MDPSLPRIVSFRSQMVWLLLGYPHVQFSCYPGDLTPNGIDVGRLIHQMLQESILILEETGTVSAIASPIQRATQPRDSVRSSRKSGSRHATGFDAPKFAMRDHRAESPPFRLSAARERSRRR